MQGSLYWSLMARFFMFMMPPLVFGLAEALETAMEAKALRRIYGLSLVLTLVLSASLALVDYRYAAAQKTMARQVGAAYGRDRRVWCLAHWGLQHYLNEAGARDLDWSRGGWDQVKPGDAAVSARVNFQVMRPLRPRLSNVRKLAVDCLIPLRLISAWTGEGGFYSNATGFLPYSFSTELLEEFTVVEML